MPGPLGLALAQQGAQTAGNVINAGIGLALQRNNDQRQKRMAEKLQRMQMEGDKEMTDYNMKKQLEMWEATGYGAQMKQMKEAGLNPGLLYGMSGGGGQSSNVTAGHTSTGNAPTGGGEVMAMMQMGLQRQMQQAQIDLIKAQADKTKAEIPQVGATTENIKQQTTNAKTINAINEVEYTLKGLEQQFQERSLENRLTEINYRVSKLNEEISILAVDKEIKQETKQAEIDRIKTEALGAALNNTLTEAKTAEAKASIKKMAGDLINASRGLDIEQTKVEIQKWVETVKANFPSIVNVLGRGLNDIIESIATMATGNTRGAAYEPPKTTIGGKQ